MFPCCCVVSGDSPDPGGSTNKISLNCIQDDGPGYNFAGTRRAVSRDLLQAHSRP